MAFSLDTRLSDAQLEKLTRNFSVRRFAPNAKAAWFAMWPDYAGENMPSSDVLEQTWFRLLDSDSDIDGFLLYENTTGSLIGFLHYVLHFDTWMMNKSCYVEDAYVLKTYRASGALVALSQALIREAEEQGWERVYWMTRPDNVAARRFYSRLCEETNWIRFELNL